MSAPTQVLPSWLTLSTTLVTLPDGSVSTSSATLRLPLTYFGPSIPLGTDGVWTYGGLTPPPSTTATPTSSTTSTSPATSTITPAPTVSSSSLSSVSSSVSSSLPPSSSTAAAAANNGSHGISPSTLGAILGSILGTLLLLVLIAILFLLRQNRRRQADPNDGHPSSSFWNRQTTLLSLLSRDARRQTPIWTGWEIVDPDEMVENGRHTPGEGSPRGSGEEEDPFLTRRSARSAGTEMGQARTDTDTLVSVPAAARTGTMSTHRSGPKPGEPIISRDAQLRMEEEFSEAPPYASIRVVEPSTSNEQESPLIPPPPLNPDSLGGASRRFSSQPSLRSQKSKTEARSVISEKSLGSVGTDPQEEGAELLTARRVKVGQLNPLADPAVASSSTATPSVLGLDRLANLGRLSWFKRMSFLGTPTDSRALSYADPETAATADPYTRTPPRHSRNGSRSRPGSHSRPGSFARASPTADSFGRRPGLGLGASEDRPISTVSARSAASGNTMYYDAQSRPASSMGTRSSAGTGTPATGSTAIPPVPPMPHMQPSPLAHEVQRSTPSPEGHYTSIPTEPPAYEEHSTPRGHGESDDYTEVDVLDIPAPRPASPFSAASSRPTFPPGLVPLPTPRVWRDSHASSSPSPATDSTSGIGIDILEDEPPSADNGWRSLAGSFRPNDGRRTTFGVPTVVQPRDALQSERGSLHSMRSHLSPHSSMSPAGSAPASSRHTLTGSGSSRPTASSHSRGLTASSGGSLAHSSSISSDDRRRRRGEVGEVASPPLSAVFPGRGFPSSPPPPAHTHGEDASAFPPAYPAEGPLPMGMRSFPATVTGTMTSSGTRGTTGTDDSLTDESVTTTQTDPITGAVMHFPRLPWRSRQDRGWGDAPLHEDAPW
ncbi:hypothetical protein PYCCODRAFT_1375142 [Trametes coccinea BRFM310]|uniref:Uncharacterized protein n=1 Tax=Trametes coccinea (strain BRFM310) TaxID=1353009 RepID=A0A1Y2ICY1_TRAC3|nr:hypothetical protein PYCCODRAFT_1375142 [Trametes coccinea BRFM310]